MSEVANPLLEGLNKIPGETFRLPSGGLFYTDGELSEEVTGGEVHVYPMTTVDELIMKSPDKILTGKAIQEVFGRCIPDILKPEELLANDVDYLMAALRVVTYGEDARVIAKHTCEDSDDHEYIVNIRDLLREARDIDPTSLEKKFNFVLDGYSLSIRPPRYRSVVALYQAISEEFIQESSEEEVALRLIENLADMIESVNEHKDSKHIAEWLTQIKAGWVNKISEHTRANSNWGVEYERTKECKDCGKEFTITVPTNPVTFFM